MTWEAANIHKTKERDSRNEAVNGEQRSAETVEAALARLTKAYSTAISCIGLLHKLHDNIDKEPEKSSEIKDQCSRVAQAARDTLEKAILTDPLISANALTWLNVVKEIAKEAPRHWSFCTADRPSPPTLSSSSHKATVRELAYLSLLNYADLLVAASPQTDQFTATLLEKGVVKRLSFIGWTEEHDERLALVALCDASKLDKSDPVLWLKLACAARRLSRKLGTLPLKYMRLERYALECGMVALPSNVPPNRSIVRAMKEHRLVDTFYPETTAEVEPITTLTLDLPRYSWSILGRMLMRACREGTGPGGTKGRGFASPVVELKISPMLVLPPKSLGTICSYLENGDIWKFEATCRALSVSIISARALWERRQSAQKQAEDTEPKNINEDRSKNDSNIGPEKPEKSTQPNEAKPEERKEQEQARSSRSSKRVRSQLITSGKKSERLAKRNSVSFCLVASVLNTLPGNRNYKVSAKYTQKDWARLYDDKLPIGCLPSPDAPKRGSTSTDTGGVVDIRLGDSCMTAFIQKWSSSNGGPFDMLKRYLAHVALNVNDVFGSDQDSLALGSFVTDCIDLLSNQQGIPQSLDPCNFGYLAKIADKVEHFAVCVLDSELRLKRCEGQPWDGQEYDTDENTVALAISSLMESIQTMEVSHPSLLGKKLWLSLKTRCHWLAAGYFFERSRVAQNYAESRKAEVSGVKQVTRAIECLKFPLANPIGSVSTPHLASPRRSGAHWRALNPGTLNAFLDDLQASAVVSSAKAKFHEQLVEIEAHWRSTGTTEIPEAGLSGLVEVGKILLERYDVPFEASLSGGGKHQELLDDFLTVCEKQISSTCDQIYKTYTQNNDIALNVERRWGDLWILLPFGAKVEIEKFINVENPSIMMILLSCLSSQSENGSSVLLLLTRVARAVFFAIDAEYQEKHLRKAQNDDIDYFSDDDSFSDMELEDDLDQQNDRMKLPKHKVEQRVRLLLTVAEFVLDKIFQLCLEVLPNSDKKKYAASNDLLCLSRACFDFISNWYERRSKKVIQSDGSRDLSIFLALSRLRSVLPAQEPSQSLPVQLDLSYFLGLCRIFVAQRHIFDSVVHGNTEKGSKHSTRQKECLSRCELLGAIASELAAFLSLRKSTLTAHMLIPNPLLKMLAGKETERMSREGGNCGFLGSLIDATLFLWLCASQNPQDISASLERILREELLVPIAALIVTLCGSGVKSVSKWDLQHDSGAIEKLHLTEFFDSDASVHVEDSDDNEEGSEQSKKKYFIKQSLCQSIHCIALVFQTVQDCSSLKSRLHLSLYQETLPSFPLIVQEILSFFADILLVEFGTKDSREEKLWANEHPIGLRKVGGTLDNILHKAYRYLYGFIIYGHWNAQEKDKASPSSSEDAAFVAHVPESVEAVSQLYRCIRRAYAKSRKSPPKAALECVTNALPPAKMTNRGKAIRDYIFDNETTLMSLKGIRLLADKNPKLEEQFGKYILPIKEATSEGAHDELSLLRKGICHDLAKGPLPSMNCRQEEKGGQSEERASAASHERELAKKFWAIIEDLSYDNPFSVQGWIGCAECLRLKADLVADRIGLTRGFLKQKDFIVMKGRRSNPHLDLRLVTLLEKQEQAERRRVEGRVEILGNDLALFVDYQWASFESLRGFADTLISSFRSFVSDAAKKGIGMDEESQLVFEAHVLKEIEAMYKRRDFAEWQEALGGLFVSTLKFLTLRCYGMAAYLLETNITGLPENDKRDLKADIFEAIGILKYSSTQAKQAYGYPLHLMSTYRCRLEAESALVCFETAFSTTKDVDDPQNQVTYDLLFMIGKCHERIAKTHTGETFKSGGEVQVRAYEKGMEAALSNYSMAVEEAKGLEAKGALADVQAGGSSHGVTELIYRLHASRFKCLLHAIQYPDFCLEEALGEAVRLTTKQWYGEEAGVHDAKTKEALLRVTWEIFSDTVAALSQCRLDHSFFHRSVYRYAQALMWAPVFCDPIKGFAEGSLGTIPATKSHKVRGLNSSTPCADSAELIIGALFEKKRPQLCGVWVTTSNTSPSPLEILNESTRKYDSLRSKYIHGYIESLTLNGHQNILETFQQWVYSSKRDLPSFYRISATEEGCSPSVSHMKEPLLRKHHSQQFIGFLNSVKREVNKALARGLLSEPAENTKRSSNEALKRAYTCFLRLNVGIEELTRRNMFKFNRAKLPEVDALMMTYLSRKDTKTIEFSSSDWSSETRKSNIIKAALEKCKQLFPALPQALYVKKKSSKKKNENADDNNNNNKRAANGMVQFVVDVPEHLQVGDKFETTVRIGDQMKTIRLTVPVGNPSKLKFSLKAPDEGYPPKRMKSQEDDPES